MKKVTDPFDSNRNGSGRNYVGYGPYRPRSLAEHPKAKPFYQDQASTETAIQTG